MFIKYAQWFKVNIILLAIFILIQPATVLATGPIDASNSSEEDPGLKQMVEDSGLARTETETAAPTQASAPISHISAPPPSIAAITPRPAGSATGSIVGYLSDLANSNWNYASDTVHVVADMFGIDDETYVHSDPFLIHPRDWNPIVSIQDEIDEDHYDPCKDDIINYHFVLGLMVGLDMGKNNCIYGYIVTQDCGYFWCGLIVGIQASHCDPDELMKLFEEVMKAFDDDAKRAKKKKDMNMFGPIAASGGGGSSSSR